MYQEEECPDTRRRHIQGYIEFKERVRLSQIHKAYPTVHWETRRGTPSEAALYCKKTDSRVEGGLFYEAGVMSIGRVNSGARNDLSEACVALRSSGIQAVVEQFPETFVKFHGGFRAMANIIAPCRAAGLRTVYVLWGEPGSGKTRFAVHLADQLVTNSVYFPVQNNQGNLSFETYSNQKTIVLDDFDEKQMSKSSLKVITDRYQTPLPGRNHSPMNNADQIIVTSNSNPETWYLPDTTFWPALRRRCTFILNCNVHAWSVHVCDGEQPLDFTPYPMPQYAEASA